MMAGPFFVPVITHSQKRLVRLSKRLVFEPKPTEEEAGPVAVPQSFNPTEIPQGRIGAGPARGQPIGLGEGITQGLQFFKGLGQQVQTQLAEPIVHSFRGQNVPEKRRQLPPAKNLPETLGRLVAGGVGAIPPQTVDELAKDPGWLQAVQAAGFVPARAVATGGVQALSREFKVGEAVVRGALQKTAQAGREAAPAAKQLLTGETGTVGKVPKKQAITKTIAPVTETVPPAPGAVEAIRKPGEAPPRPVGTSTAEAVSAVPSPAIIQGKPKPRLKVPPAAPERPAEAVVPSTEAPRSPVAVEEPPMKLPAKAPVSEGVSPPPPPKGPIIGGVQGMWEKPFEPPRVPVKERLTNAYVKMQEQWTDRLAWGNRQAGVARQEYFKATGRRLPAEMDFEVQGAFLGASDSAGLQRFADTQRKAAAVLGKDINPDTVDSFLHLKHSGSVLTAKGPKRLVAGGIKTVADTERGIAELQASVGPEKFVRVEAAAKEYQAFSQRLLQRDVEEGLITPELAAQLQEMYPWYTPIKYQDMVQRHFSASGGKRISVTANGLRRLSEVGREAATERPTATLLSHAVVSEQRIQANRAARSLIQNMEMNPALKDVVKLVRGTRPVAQVEGEAVFRPVKGELRGTISYMAGGKRRIYQVPPEAETMAKRFGESPLGDVSGAIRVVQNPFKAAFVTYNPSFMAANSVFDMTVVATTRGVLPWEAGAAFAKNLIGLLKYDATMAEIIRSGGAVVGWHGKDARQVAAEYAKSGRVILYKDVTAKKLLTQPWEMLRDIGHALELAPRRAVFEKELRHGLSPAEAALAFRRSTVDFARIGQSMRLANALYLFLNPAVQGTLLPLRALRDVPAAKYGLAGLAGVGMAAYAWNRRFPEYADVPLYDKYGGMVVMIPSDEIDRFGKKVPHYIKLPPLLRELAAFTAPITYLLGKLDGQAPESTERFLGSMVRQLNPFSNIIGGGIPVPTQIGETLTEVALNHDAFRGRPIVPVEMEHLPPEQQFDTRTSETARRLGGLLQVSPFKIDHILRTGVLWEFFGVLDGALRIKDGHDPYIDGLAERLKEIQETAPPDQIPLLRRKFLGSLSTEDRDAVLEVEQMPEPRIPFIESVVRRFYKKQGGNLYTSGQAAAQRELGVSSKQTREASRIMGRYVEELSQAQEKLDLTLTQGVIDRKQWREAHKTQGNLYRGAYGVISVMYPGAAQVLGPENGAAYRHVLATIANTMPDLRTKGELLYAAWRSIPILEIVPGVEDWDTYFRTRDAFEAGLSPEHQRLLREWRMAYMTPIEKEWDEAKETLKPYWGVGRDLLPNLRGADRDVWERYLKASQTERDEVSRTATVKRLLSQQSIIRLRLRRQVPAIDAALVKWYGYKSQGRPSAGTLRVPPSIRLGPTPVRPKPRLRVPVGVK